MIPDVDTHRIPALLADDIRGTLGESYLSLLREIVASAYELVIEPSPHPDDPQCRGLFAEQFSDDGEAQARFDWKVTEGFQQRIHDEHIDVTWPACPRHPNHPLVVDHDNRSWICPMDSTLAFPLGTLTDAIVR